LSRLLLLRQRGTTPEIFFPKATFATRLFNQQQRCKRTNLIVKRDRNLATATTETARTLQSLQFASNGKQAGNVTTGLGIFRDIVLVGSLRVCQKYGSTIKQKDVNTFINKHEIGKGGVGAPNHRNSRIPGSPRGKTVSKVCKLYSLAELSPFSQHKH